MHSNTENAADFSYPFSELLQNSTIIFYHCSLEENYPIVFISDNVQDILGYQPEEFYSSSTFWMDKIHPEDREKVNAAFLDILNEKRRVFEYRIRHKNGDYLWIRDENTVSYDDQGEPKAITGTAINISGQKEAEEEVKKLNATLEQRIEERTRDLSSANRKLKKQIQYRNKAELKLDQQQKQLKILQMAIANINDMVIITKAPVENPLDSEIVFVNKSFESFTGYRMEEVEEKNPSFLHGSETDPKVANHIQKKISAHEPLRVEFLNYKKDGRPYWVELDMAPFPADEEGYEYWVGVNRDITKRKKAELNLEESEYRYRAYSELSFDAIFEISLDGTITDCNTRASEMFGYSRNELVGMNTLKLTPKEYRGIQPDRITEEFTTGDEALEREYKKKDGTVFTCAINTKIYTRGGEKRLIAYVRDISDQKAYEEAIQASLKDKEVLLAEIHHRVKNNLAIISGLLEMQTFNSTDDRITNELKESQSRIQSIAMVHEKLYQSESLSDIALDAYIGELLQFISGTFYQGEKEVDVIKDIDPISLEVQQAIPCGLILNELITNAYKHGFKDIDNGQLRISLKEEGGKITMMVKNNGSTLPDDFDISQSSSLGMTLIQTLVKQLEGSLDISSEGDTCFAVTFSSKKKTAA
ncbi:MAG: PAS domain S-box protein [Balneolaceae bacterium]|nr:PAS domain S-box protein [Balneolaceae bacterium]